MADMASSVKIHAEVGPAEWINAFLPAHKGRFVGALERFGGHFHSGKEDTDDQEVCVFQTVKDAVDAAVLIQIELGHAAKLSSGLREAVRIAIHAPEQDVYISRHSPRPVYDTKGIEACSRILPIAKPDQILISPSAHHRLADVLGELEDVSFHLWPARRLKDSVADVYEVLYAGRSPSEPSCEAYEPWYEDIARTAQIALPQVEAEWRQWLDQAGQRVLFVWGLSGIGKTRFVKDRLHADAARFQDGIKFVDLSGCSKSTGEPLNTLLNAMRRSGRVTPRRLGDLQEFRKSNFILVLDNWESVDTDEARQWLLDFAAAAKCRIVVTSAVSIDEPSFRLLHLKPMLPDQRLELLKARTTAVNSDYPFDRNLDALKSVAVSSGGLPFFIEILAKSAAKLDGIDLKEFAEELAGGKEQIHRGPKGMKPRHQTVGQVLEWCFRTQPDELETFSWFSFFEGPVRAKDAEAIAEISKERLNSWRELDVLDYQDGLYRANRVLRDECRKRIDRSKRAELSAKLAEHCRAECQSYVQNGEAEADLLAIEARFVIFAQAAELLAEARQGPETLQVLNALYECALPNHRQEVVQVMGACANLLKETKSAEAARIMAWHGVFLKEVNRFEEAQLVFSKSLQMWQELDQVIPQIGVRINLMNALQGQGKLDQARSEGQELPQAISRLFPDVKTNRSSSGASLMVQALENLALLEERAGNYAVAIDYANQALEIRPSRLTALVSLGNALLGDGRAAEVRAIVHRALEQVTNWDNPYTPVLAELVGYYNANLGRHNDALTAWAFAAKYRAITGDQIETVDREAHDHRVAASRKELADRDGAEAVSECELRGEGLSLPDLAKLID